MTKNLQSIKNAVLLGVAFFMLNSGTVVKAQTEITVEPGFNALVDAAKANPGATLILKRGGDYTNDVEVPITVATIIKGEKEPAGTRPALISMYADPGLAQEKWMVDVSADLTVQDVAFFGQTADDQQIRDHFLLEVPDIKLTLDGCFFQAGTRIIHNGALNGLTIIEKNCTFYNMGAMGWDNAGGIGYEWAGDNMDFQAYNNTYFEVGRCFNATGVGPNGSEKMVHNTMVATWGDVYFPMYTKNITVKNNIYYDAQIRSYVGLRHDAVGGILWPGDYSDWKLDSLCGMVPIFPHESDSVGDRRQVTVTHNLKLYSPYVLDFHAANKVSSMTLFNVTDRTKFAPKYGWDFSNNMLQEDGNAIDPQFAGGTIPPAAYVMAFKERQERSLPATMQGPDYPYYIAWIPEGKTRADFAWPLPMSFKPTNPAIFTAGDDGYPLGDLNWFGPQVVADWEAGKVFTSAKTLNNKSEQSAYIANDVLKFKGFDKAVNVEVYSILGQKVLNAKNINELSVSSLKRGVYMIRVNGTQTFKVTK